MATVATYCSHVNRALNFHFNTKNLMFGIGRSTPWGEKPGETSGTVLIDEKHPPYPSLDMTEVEELIGYKRINNMFFVVPDETSVEPIVDGVKWRKIAVSNPSPDPEVAKTELINLVKQEKSRWIYIDAFLDPTDFVGFTYRQLGLYSDLKILPPATNSQIIFNPEHIQTGSGFLEVVQNRSPVTRQIDMREMISVVLEF